MDESSPHEFDPARTLTDLASDSITKWTRKIYLDSWLHKREISRSHTDIYLFAKNIREHRLDRELEVRYADSSVYYNSFYLIKCVIMSSIDIFVSEYSSRDDGSDRCIFISHDQILHT
jgi:hypothetical protein